MQPYQQATEEIIRQKNAPGRFIKNAAITAASTAGGLGLMSKVAPFLSEFIPAETAIKGISKVSPKLGGFINVAMKNGLSEEGVLDFIGKKLGKEQEKSKSKSLIESFNPDLFNLIGEEIQKGIDPKSIVTRLKVEGMKKLVDDIEKKSGSTLEQMIIDEFGQGQPSMQQQIPEEPQQQSGQGQQALMSILQKLQQARSGR